MDGLSALQLDVTTPDLEETHALFHHSSGENVITQITPPCAIPLWTDSDQGTHCTAEINHLLAKSWGVLKILYPVPSSILKANET